MLRGIAISLSCCVLAATSASADLTFNDPDRILLLSADTPTNSVFLSRLDVTGFGPINESREDFGFAGPNFIAGFLDQRSEVPASLDGSENSPLLFQGSASMSASIANQDPVSGIATSLLDLSFTLSATTDLQLTWALSADGPTIEGPTSAAASIALDQVDGSGTTTILSAIAYEGDNTDGSGVLTLDAGEYRIRIGASAVLYQGASVINGGFFTLPAEITNSAAYTVTLAVVPAPATLLPLAGLVVVGGRRRRHRPCA
ncbi:MAG: hypothetical protein ACF8Q5_01555 [Phycisphaerales bacterium JB040]